MTQRPPRTASRRPAAARTSAARIAAGPGADQGTGHATGSGAGLTTRAAVLGLALCALVVSAALPLRELLDQRGEITALQQEQGARAGRVAALEEQRRLLEDPAYVKRVARERLQFVMPGERAYVVVAPPTAPVAAPAADGPGPVGAAAPWYSQLWGSAQEADRPADPG